MTRQHYFSQLSPLVISLLSIVMSISSMEIENAYPRDILQPIKQVNRREPSKKISQSNLDESTCKKARALLDNSYVDYWQGKYQLALERTQTALQLFQDCGDRQGEAKSRNNLGEIYFSLGQYSQAIAFYQSAIKIKQDLQDREGQAVTLANLANIYIARQNYAQALQQINQALTILEAVSEPLRTLTYPQNQSQLLGVKVEILLRQGQTQKALNFAEQSLANARKYPDYFVEVDALSRMGDVYRSLGKLQQANQIYQQALAIAKDIHSRPSEAILLSKIGDLLVVQKQEEQAITFYKQSVNVTQIIRQALLKLSPEQQKSYIETISSTYRTLAKLLLAQGRGNEAQQVLDLLKFEEIQDRRQAEATIPINNLQATPTEQKILDRYQNLIALGQQIAECERTNCQQLSRLYQQREALIATYNAAIDGIIEEIRQQKGVDDAFLDPRYLNTSAQKIVEAQTGTLLIYPLVLQNELWLLWVAPKGIVGWVVVPVKRQHLGETVLKFRQLLSSPSSNPAEVRATAQQLYEWLVQPLAAALEANRIENLVFALDRVTRYIPMSVLFDGQQYLVEKYRISTIFSAESTATQVRSPVGSQDATVLALGVSEPRAGLAALPNVPTELTAIVRSDAKGSQGIYPGQIFLNQSFTFRALADNLLGYQVLHIATHAQFASERPDASYLLLGDGQKLTIGQINQLFNLSTIDLVVLSACETALGGPNAEGLEIAGLSYYFTVGNRAKSILASLWLVNDLSTSQLMKLFYQNLATGKMSKAEALRQAQLTLLRGNSNASGAQRGSFKIEVVQDGKPALINRNLSHPYYWAPFILIGNGL